MNFSMFRHCIVRSAGRLMLMLALLPASAHAQTLTVFAAASLKEALDDVLKVWRQGAGSKTVVSYAASSALAKQIESGAPADVFLSADFEWMDYLQGRKFVRSDTRVDLLKNRIVLIAPATSGVQLVPAPGFPIASALGRDRLAMADPASVPAGKYGKAALEALGVWNAVSGRVAAAENVRVALLFVARGEAPLGIVYATDAKVEPRVRIVGTFPENTHPPIVYPVAVTSQSRNPGAFALVGYLKQPAARRIFEYYGFQ